MKKYTVNSMGLKCTIDGPSTLEEYEKMTGHSALEDAVSNQILTKVLPRFRSVTVGQIVIGTGLPLESKPKMDKEGKPVVDDKGQPVLVITEKEGDYVERAAKAVGQKVEYLQIYADQALAAEDEQGNKLVSFVPIIKSREKADKPPGKKMVELAKAMITSEDYAKNLAALRKKTGLAVAVTGDVESDAVIIAKALEAFQKNLNVLAQLKR